MNRKALPFIVALCALLAMAGCRERYKTVKLTLNQSLNGALLKIMRINYYWADKLPQDVDFMAYESPYELMEVLRYRPIDKWSYVSTLTEYTAYYTGASYAGFGYASGFDADGNYRISYVYPQAPMYKDYGIDRGWRIIAIEGQTPTRDNVDALLGPKESGLSRTFTFVTPKGDTVQHTLTKSHIKVNTVLKDTILSMGGRTIGYFNLSSFIEPTEQELFDVFAKFRARGVNELIVDLRYNGGGIVDAALTLGNLIAGAQHAGKIFCTFYHNNTKRQRDTNLLFRNMPDTSLTTLSRVAFITSEGSASASELLINALKPFMEVHCVGQRTHGKPVGMYTFPFANVDCVFVPICFSGRNANGEGDYFDGLPVETEAEDDILHSFGSPDEACMAAALRSLGIDPGAKAKSRPVSKFTPITLHGLDAEIGAK